MRCVILQPSYIPWRGYFHQIQKADVFVFYDDVQYDKRGWRNRNRIKTPDGVIWLTVPVHASGAQTECRTIREIQIANERPWARKHLLTLERAYGKAPYFERFFPVVSRILLNEFELLADLDIDLTVALAESLGIEAPRFVRSSMLNVGGVKTERLLAVLEAVGASHYISGPSARAYLDEALLSRAGIALEYMQYCYPEYEQVHPPYDPQVSILDLLFTKGPDAGRWIWGENPEP